MHHHIFWRSVRGVRVDTNIINIIRDLISNLGVPIFIVIYFMYDRYKVTIPLIGAINKNTTVIARLMSKIGEDDLFPIEGGDSHQKG